MKPGWVELESLICWAGCSSTGSTFLVARVVDREEKRRNKNGETIGFLLLNSYKNTINVTANPIKLQPCSCCFDLIKNWTKRTFPSLPLRKKIHTTHSDPVFVTLIVPLMTVRRAYLPSTMLLLCGRQLTSIPTALRFEVLAGPNKASWRPLIK